MLLVFILRFQMSYIFLVVLCGGCWQSRVKQFQNVLLMFRYLQLKYMYVEYSTIDYFGVSGTVGVGYND